MLTNLSPHTKVRRIGYLKLIVEQYLRSDYHPINSFSLSFEKTASNANLKQQLSDYEKYYKRDSNGVIENIGSGKSAQPYIDFAEDISIIAKINYSYVLTKHSKVYKTLYDLYQNDKEQLSCVSELGKAKQMGIFKELGFEKNIFVLNTLDGLFFIKHLLEKDFLILKSILKIISEKQPIKISEKKIKYLTVKENLLDTIVSELHSYLKSESIRLSEKQQANVLLKKYSGKELKIRSYESIVEPRISWLLDLNLLDGDRYNFGTLSLTPQGETLWNILNNKFDVFSFIENSYFKSLNAVYHITTNTDKPKEKRIEKYLDEAFIYFKTLAPNRVTASQAIYYCCFMCILKDGLVVEYSEVKKFLFDTDGKKYMIDWFPSENDGSLKKIEK